MKFAAKKLPLALVSTLLIGAVLAAPAAAAKPFPAGVQKRLGAALSSSWSQTVAPGAIVAVTVGDRTWTAVRGSTRKGKEVRPRLADHTRIGSLTKTFTATLILQLVDDGKLKLTDTIDKWFPWVPNASQITVRELGDMGSGINTYTANQEYLDAYFGNPQAAWTPIEAIKFGVSLPPRFAPGQGFFYSNTNFLLLGKIAEDVTGKPFGHLLRERIFDPLGMTHTSYPYSTALPAPYLSGYTDQDASGTGDGIFNATHWNPTSFGAAGQIVSDLGDMQIWAKAIGTGSLLTKAGHRAQLTPNPRSVKGGRSYDFGVGEDNGWITHSGTVPGYNTDFGYLKKLDASIVVLTSTDIQAKPGSSPAVSTMSALSAVIAPDDVSTP